LGEVVFQKGEANAQKRYFDGRRTKRTSIDQGAAN